MEFFNTVRYFILIILFFSEEQANAQIKVNTNAASNPGKTVVKELNTSYSVNLTAEEMTSFANASEGVSVTTSFIASDQKIAGNGQSEALGKFAKEKLDLEIYGSTSPKEYGITYMSHPVRVTYDNYIAPYISIFMELNDEIYEGKMFREIITNGIADQLLLLSENTDILTTPGARDRLRVEVTTQLANELYPAESSTQEYWEEHLSQITKRIAGSLDFGDFQKSVKMLTSFAARNNCAIAVIIAKSKINTIRHDSALTDLLDEARGKYLYRPLTDYKNQASAFDIYLMKMGGLQAATQNNNLHLFYDKDNRCPSPHVYSFILSDKLRSASVFNNLK